MDNVIYIILAAAVFIAMAGILLFIGTDSLEDVGNDADDIRETDPEDEIDLSSYSSETSDTSDVEKISLQKDRPEGLAHG